MMIISVRNTLLNYDTNCISDLLSKNSVKRFLDIMQKNQKNIFFMELGNLDMSFIIMIGVVLFFIWLIARFFNFIKDLFGK